MLAQKRVIPATCMRAVSCVEDPRGARADLGSLHSRGPGSFADLLVLRGYAIDCFITCGRNTRHPKASVSVQQGDPRPPPERGARRAVPPPAWRVEREAGEGSRVAPTWRRLSLCPPGCPRPTLLSSRERESFRLALSSLSSLSPLLSALLSSSLTVSISRLSFSAACSPPARRHGLLGAVYVEAARGG